MTYRLTLKEELAAMNSERSRLERRYRCSSRYVLDALEWVADAPQLDDELAAQIFAAYNASTAFRTVIDDAEAGEGVVVTVHNYHPDTHLYGLADGCERCAEHAQHPRISLDLINLAALEARIQAGMQPRSDNERIAMQNLTQASR